MLYTQGYIFSYIMYTLIYTLIYTLYTFYTFYTLIYNLYTRLYLYKSCGRTEYTGKPASGGVKCILPRFAPYLFIDNIVNTYVEKATRGCGAVQRVTTWREYAECRVNRRVNNIVQHDLCSSGASGWGTRSTRSGIPTESKLQSQWRDDQALAGRLEPLVSLQRTILPTGRPKKTNLSVGDWVQPYNPSKPTDY
ncbi:hypothetical protein BJX70DRAFT_79612 [Aspergillus crustosus]